MSSKIYKVNGDHLNAIGEAVGIIVAFLESIKADDALLNFSAAQVLNKLRKPEAVPATLEQAVDDQAERAMANLEHTHTVCKCKKGAVAAVCKCRKKSGKVGEKQEKSVKTGKTAVKNTTMKELAEELGVNYKAMKTYAYRHDLGFVRLGPRGNLVRELFAADVDAIREHFKK